MQVREAKAAQKYIDKAPFHLQDCNVSEIVDITEMETYLGIDAYSKLSEAKSRTK